MAGTGDGHQSLPGGAGLVHLPAHPAGHKIVRFSMEEDHRNTAGLQSLHGRIRIRIESAEEKGTQAHHGIAKIRRQMHPGGNHFLHDRPGRTVAAVGKDSDDVGGQFPSSGHHHRGSTHGDAREDDFHIGTEFFHRKIHPGKAVPVLFDTEGDHISFTFSGAPLIHHQRIPAAPEAPVHTPGQIPLGTAPIAVEHQLHGRSGGIFVVFSRQTQTVEGGNLHLFRPSRPGLPDPVFHIRPKRLVDFPLGQYNPLRVRRLPGRGIKGDPEAKIAGYRHRQNRRQ